MATMNIAMDTIRSRINFNVNNEKNIFGYIKTVMSLAGVDQKALKSCCLVAAVSAAVAVAVAQFYPDLASNLPAGSIRNLYMKPFYFGLAIGLLVLVISGLAQMSMKPSDEYSYYSGLLNPEKYGYGGIEPSTGSSNTQVQFKNYV